MIKDGDFTYRRRNTQRIPRIANPGRRATSWKNGALILGNSALAAEGAPIVGCFHRPGQQYILYAAS